MKNKTIEFATSGGTLTCKGPPQILTPPFNVWLLTWTEYEFGQRPDGATVHKNQDDCKKFVKAFWDAEHRRNPSGRTPEGYSKEDGDGFAAIITDEKVYRDLLESDKFGIWLTNDGWRGLKYFVEHH